LNFEVVPFERQRKTPGAYRPVQTSGCFRCIYQSIGKGTKPLPEYYFVIQKPNGETDSPRWTILPTDRSALTYARHIVNDLRQAPEHGDLSRTMLLQNAKREMTFSIPFWS
jgi:hypothetical protein